MIDRLEDLAVDQQVERMQQIAETLSGIIRAHGGKMPLKESRNLAAQALKTTVDQVDYGVVYGESTRTLAVPGGGVYITA